MPAAVRYAQIGIDQHLAQITTIDHDVGHQAEVFAAIKVLEEVPADALTASSSGLDPHISPEYAALQTARVAEARGLSLDRVEDLVAEYTEGRDLGYLGDPTVNVAALNLALDELED